MTSLGFYDRIAPTYDAAMADDRARLLRRRFQEMVVRHTDPGGAILDLGAGTGLDARWYADRGYRVIAYDTSAGMMARLRERCSEQIADGLVVPVQGRDGLERHADRLAAVRTLAGNFAVVNLLPDLDELGGLLRRLPLLTAAVLSLQNPFFPGDMLRGWWWRGLLRSPGQRAIDGPDGEVLSRRYFVGAVRRVLGPELTLTEQVSTVGGRVYGRFPGNRLGHLRIFAFTRR